MARKFPFWADRDGPSDAGFTVSGLKIKKIMDNSWIHPFLPIKRDEGITWSYSLIDRVDSQLLDRKMPGKQIDENDFSSLISRRSHSLLSLADYLVHRGPTAITLTRPLLGQILSQATQMEELLDAYGARNNNRWCKFRSYAAIIKLFSELGYELLHIRHALPTYHLLPIERDFGKATDWALAYVRHVLSRAGVRLLTEASMLELELPGPDVDDSTFSEQLPPGRLTNDRVTRRIDNTAKVVTRLATAYLNLAAEGELLQMVAKVDPTEYGLKIPDMVSEEQIRYLKHRFHNLQSLYDTFVSETETEGLDPDLPVLRGHISVVYHLLVTATGLAHHYERHVDKSTGDTVSGDDPCVNCDELLGVLTNYSIVNSAQFVACGVKLCHAMLKRYAEIGEIVVTVPRYRGFHVRPSTLLAKIVRHYGSEVTIEMDTERFDAAAPIEIFRINEEINARKRRWLANEIDYLDLDESLMTPDVVRNTIHDIVLALSDQGKVIIYENPLKLSDRLSESSGTFMEQITAEVARLQATGKIDIHLALDVKLIGDKRVLEDIKLLAENGYGEDNFGNNIALPKALSYLRR